MKQVLIAFDENNYQGQVANFETAAELIQTVVEQYKTLNLPALSTADLYQLFTAPVDLIFDKMTEGQPISIGNHKLCKIKAIEILEKPQGFDAFLNTLNEVVAQLGANNFPPINTPINRHQLKTYFELDANGNVVVKESFIATLENSNKRFASTDAAKSMHEFATTILQKYSELEISKLHPGKPLEDIVKILFDSYSSGPALKISGITQYNSNVSFKRTSID